uniref:Uncharacterized protein n=1 Tax=Nelumbo nucifera TaxID=4432 RepID=A0A822XL55_NELNU|nr:TPA_asm: hypothetical protein HUJ06_021345 [Nelumbo nucifera]
MMCYSSSIINLVGDNIQVLVHLHFIRIYNLSSEAGSKVDGELRFSVPEDDLVFGATNVDGFHSHSGARKI